MATLFTTLFLLFSSAKGFTPQASRQVVLSCRQYSSGGDRSLTKYSAAADAVVDEEEQHPAVLGWPQKYAEAGGKSGSESLGGPRILSNEFAVQKASPSELQELDVHNWPIWTTSDKSKWKVGNQVQDKEMPYGELSYVLSGQLEIIPQSTGIPEIVNVGDFVTFPKGFVASWRVLDELTWHYFLY